MSRNSCKLINNSVNSEHQWNMLWRYSVKGVRVWWCFQKVEKNLNYQMIWEKNKRLHTVITSVLLLIVLTIVTYVSLYIIAITKNSQIKCILRGSW